MQQHPQKLRLRLQLLQQPLCQPHHLQPALKSSPMSQGCDGHLTQSLAKFLQLSEDWLVATLPHTLLRSPLIDLLTRNRVVAPPGGKDSISLTMFPGDHAKAKIRTRPTSAAIPPPASEPPVNPPQTSGVPPVTGAKPSSRVLRPPGGKTSITLG
ncbi:hypothetical protein M427DRAFT_287759 [Gonapodya prolifera JEL478]|uniref:Uncharacterized protein n=1 Tax=Gonapodya prolifera (strain JEL478) TaxID=1344416 RepID=A0A139AIE4_GONPJ|nr:hypothetical protein M427DRAFT_287759 [Gonapodya prolifera JEL478]|eukprot:KXS16572.1 hypothetical protein M427DRAFT_287759 [Gonapodya prolifera JEL478]